MKNGTIIVSRGTHVPSDLRGLWFLQYGTRPSEVQSFKREIKRLIAIIEAEPDKADNPVADYLEREGIAVASFIQRENVKRLSALFTELTGNLIILKGLASGARNGDVFSYGCLDLLCRTMYVDVGPDVFALAYEVRNRLRKLDAGLQTDISDTVEQTTILSGAVRDIMARLSRGEYDEPSVVSVMAWSGGVTKDDVSCRNLLHLEHHGELYADELSGLRLSAGQMVTLSACQTGLSDSIEHEKALGLRQAFIAASKDQTAD